MALITKSKLSAVTAFNNRILFESELGQAKRQSRPTAQRSVFLSHSHADLMDGTVDKATVFLRKLGVVVYIDSNDDSMPPTTNAVTAAQLKSRIIAADKFVFLATNQSIQSKWCNWELGFGDAHKFINRISLFPVADDNTNWQGNEYLRIYPRIEESQINGQFKVIFPNGAEQPLTEWLINN